MHRRTIPPWAAGTRLRRTQLETAPALGRKRGSAAATTMARTGDLGEHLFVVTIPIALEPSGSIVLPLQSKKLRELRITGFHLFPCGPAMIRQIVAAVATD